MYERAFSFKEGLGMVVLNSQYGFIDHTGQIRIPFKYAAAHSFEQEWHEYVTMDYGDWLTDKETTFFHRLTVKWTIRGRISPRLTTQQSRFINKKGEVSFRWNMITDALFPKDWLLFALKASHPSGDT